MDISMKWLADYVDIDEPIKKFCYDMTMTGSKVEGYEEEGAKVTNTVVGRILSKSKHENADALFVCSVDIGREEPVQIVTNAKNVKEGDLVPVALDGATLPEGKIKKGKIRGVESYGMFCGLDTLGLTLHDFPYADPEGVFVIEEDCKPGDDIHAAIGLDDTTVEFEITSNRADCLSVLGIAREAAATFQKPFNYKKPEYKGVSEDINKYLSVNVENTDLCHRYIGGIVKNVKIQPSPRWMRERLRACGVRPINNLVDITNYVMLEYGQPMHAFDIRYLAGGKINIRNAHAGEKITTLDGVDRVLSPEMLVIADAEKPVAVAGVMGGEYSGIMDDTQTVVFESACFDGASVRRTAKKLGMRTDASARFEKGLDAHGCMPAILRAFELCELLGCGEPLNSVIDCDYNTRPQAVVPFDPDWTNAFLGTDIPAQDMVGYLEKIGFEVRDGNVYSPSFRIDIESKADIAEEIARFYGYNNIKGTIITGIANAKLTDRQKLERKVESACISMGLNQINTFSFISPKYYDKIRLPQNSSLRKSVVITNPLGEDTSVMRTTVLPSMCEVVARNYNYRNPEAALFEIGTEYIVTGEDTLPLEPVRLAVGMYGNGTDFYSVKGVVDELLDTLGISEYEIEAAGEGCGFDEVSAFHPGRVAVAKVDGKPLAVFGELHPDVLETYGIGVRAYAAKVLITELLDIDIPEKTYKPLPKYPATTRDISLICDDEIPVALLEKLIKEAVGGILEKVTLFDVYKGEQIESGKKSVAFSVSMRSHDGTLTDEQADAAMKRVVKALSKINAEVR
ncbi:MAG TPA: phenylalanine--tRNA ligase subunit beta [Candidatus Faeciplasma pullistercoris]|uniref:Phenylalanine--tRNA ligase beta subunit n=1 Tax=Candidatus Faeciplasma pullistercoris TaxID=2840800 RepID=A0A9D1KK09_9FIRM|nr:phenylalanine--tRNA ligase subunit beta [Candidatus Faeciplasma pullistercoris]